MKNVKKLAGILLALVMVFGLTTIAFAATLTVPTTGIIAGHTFTAYQVLAGDETNGVLTNISWGNGIDSTAFLADLKADPDCATAFASCTTADDFATILAANSTLANQVAKLAEDNKTGTGTALVSGANTLDDGYYLIVDTTTNVGAGGAYNAALLQVVGDNIEVTEKTDVPAVEKKVLEEDYIVAGDYGTGYNDVADYDIGDEVPFHLIGLVPDMSRYDTYKYIFKDTLSAGLTAPAVADIKVYLSADKAVDAGDTDVTTEFTIGVVGQNITVSTDDLKTLTGVAEGMYIIVEYNAVLNENADVGLPGNANSVVIEYSNKPDQSGSGDTNNTGETPEDQAIVFTYELDVTKVDGSDATELPDAQFVFLNAAKDKVATFTAGKFDGWVDIPANEAWAAASILTSNAQGLFTIVGIDDGTYYLREIQAPATYNMLTADVEVIITATTANGQTWDGTPATALTDLDVTADGVAGTGDATTGIAEINIANNKGNTLPETGGIGTTIFYIVGSLLVVGAAVLLITKRRTGQVEEN